MDFRAADRRSAEGDQRHERHHRDADDLRRATGRSNTKLALYFATVVVLGAVYLGCRALVRSRFGAGWSRCATTNAAALQSATNGDRQDAGVHDVAGIAGLAGVLLVPQLGIISPKQLDIAASIEIVIWVAVGGRGTLAGAVLGAVLVNTGKSTLSSSYPDLWQLIMGGLFVGVVLLFPKGIVGSLNDLMQRVRPLRRAMFTRAAPDAPAIEPETA